MHFALKSGLTVPSFIDTITLTRMQAKDMLLRSWADSGLSVWRFLCDGFGLRASKSSHPFDPFDAQNFVLRQPLSSPCQIGQSLLLDMSILLAVLVQLFLQLIGLPQVGFLGPLSAVQLRGIFWVSPVSERVIEQLRDVLLDMLKHCLVVHVSSKYFSACSLFEDLCCRFSLPRRGPEVKNNMSQRL